MNEEYNFYEFRAKTIKEMLESKYKSIGLENFHNNPKKTLNVRKTRLNQRAREVFGDNLIIIDKESEIYSLNKNI